MRKKLLCGSAAAILAAGLMATAANVAPAIGVIPGDRNAEGVLEGLRPIDLGLTFQAPAKAPNFAEEETVLTPGDPTWLIGYQLGADLRAVTLEWSPVTTDSDGNPLPEGTEVYYVFATSIADFGNRITTTPNATTVDLTIFDADVEPEPSIERFGVWAVIKYIDSEGEEQYSYSSGYALSALVPLGELCTVPYEESWPNGKTSTNAGFELVTGKSYFFSIHDQPDTGNVSDGWESVDGDEGLTGFYSWGVGHSSRFCFSCIGIDEEASDPQLSFYYTLDIVGNWQDEIPDDDFITVEVFANGRLAFSETFTPDTSIGWKKYTATIPGCQGKTIVPMITAGTPTLDSHYIFFDKVRVENAGGNNLAFTSLSAPEEVELNQDFDVTYAITNTGGNAAKGYTVKLYRNGDLLESAMNLPEIAAGETYTGKFVDFLTDPETTDYTYHAVLIWPDDEDDTDNRSEDLAVKLRTESSGIAAVEAAGAVQAEYFNMLGIKVAQPAPGTLYLVRRGNTVTKELVK